MASPHSLAFLGLLPAVAIHPKGQGASHLLARGCSVRPVSLVMRGGHRREAGQDFRGSQKAWLNPLFILDSFCFKAKVHENKASYFKSFGSQHE